MAREYRHIKMYEKEIITLKKQGLTHREIGEQLGFSKEQIKDFFKRYRKNQKKLESGIPLKRRGRPLKDKGDLPSSIQQLSKLSQLQYELARKEQQIKQLEMENELMRDFLSFTERK